MANTKQAKKRARQNDTRRTRNASQRSEMRTYLKQVTKAVQEGNTALATSLYKKSASIVDRLANKGLIHQNKASRHKSRLNAHLKSMLAKQK